MAVKVTVRDQGPGSLTRATVAVALPRYATATSSDCAVADGAVTCLIGAIPAGGSASASFLLPVKPLALGPLVLTAKRTASTPRDPNPANDAASVRCNVLTRLIITCDSR